MCINQKRTAELMQSGEQSVMRQAAAGHGMHCQGQVSGTQTARRAALAQPSQSQGSGKKVYRPLFCLGNYALHKL